MLKLEKKCQNYSMADLKLDLDRIDQPSVSWDVVFCKHVLDYKRALRESYRILQPGGRLICSFQIDMRYETVQEDVSLVGVDTPEADQERILLYDSLRLSSQAVCDDIAEKLDGLIESAEKDKG